MTRVEILKRIERAANLGSVGVAMVAATKK